MLKGIKDINLDQEVDETYQMRYINFKYKNADLYLTIKKSGKKWYPIAIHQNDFCNVQCEEWQEVEEKKTELFDYLVKKPAIRIELVVS